MDLKYRPGMFCWTDLASPNLNQTKEFYGQLFGWLYQDVPNSQVKYSIATINNLKVAGIYESCHEGQAHPAYWLPYVMVQDIDSTFQKAKSFGANVIANPMDVTDAGRCALFSDPTGAVFALWEAKNHQGASYMGNSGAFCWFELNTSNIQKAAEFYLKLFEWRPRRSDLVGFAYTEFYAGPDHPIGGMMGVPKVNENKPSRWLTYFEVADCDDTAKKTLALGGKIVTPPIDIPKVGRFALLNDPHGAPFAVIKLRLN